MRQNHRALLLELLIPIVKMFLHFFSKRIDQRLGLIAQMHARRLHIGGGVYPRCLNQPNMQYNKRRGFDFKVIFGRNLASTTLLTNS